MSSRKRARRIRLSALALLLGSALTACGSGRVFDRDTGGGGADGDTGPGGGSSTSSTLGSTGSAQGGAGGEGIGGMGGYAGPTGGTGGTAPGEGDGGAGGAPPTEPTDYCNAYYPPGHPARSAPGFSVPTTVLEPMVVGFSDVFVSGGGYGPPVTLQQILDNETAGRGPFAGPWAGPGKYMTIPIDIPAETPAKTGFGISMVEPQGYQGMSSSTELELTISPCPGDFRARPWNNDSSDLYDRRQCGVKTSGGIFASTGNLDGPNGYCFLKPGTRMYINITNHSLDDYRATGATPTWGCKEDVTNCGKKADIRWRGDD